MVDARPAKVECLSRHKQHTLRTARSRARGAAATPAKPPAVVVDLDEKLRGREKTAVAYDPKRACALDEVIRHPSFGLGIVVALPAPQRMEVAFRSGRKYLVHDRAGAQPALKRPTLHAGDGPTGASDAPPGK